MQNNKKIGIFDSGVGGLTVVSEVFKALPHEEIIYFGDTARVPYGSKSKETVLKYSVQIMNFLMKQDIKAAIIACGTVSSNCYEELSGMFDVPMVEMVKPGAVACLKATKNNKIGVIGTERTIKSGAYERHIKSLRPESHVYSKACPLFVPLAEEGWLDNPVSELTAGIYLQELVDAGIDSLLIGCTHYPLLLNCIQKVTGGINIINPAKAAAEQMKSLLTEKNMLREMRTADSFPYCNRSHNNDKTQHVFYLSDDTDKFNMICEIALCKQYPVMKAVIE